jgi:Skp family chaperone for outer membrane proteins
MSHLDLFSSKEINKKEIYRLMDELKEYKTNSEAKIEKLQKELDKANKKIKELEAELRAPTLF